MHRNAIFAPSYPNQQEQTQVVAKRRSIVLEVDLAAPVLLVVRIARGSDINLCASTDSWLGTVAVLDRFAGYNTIDF